MDRAVAKQQFSYAKGIFNSKEAADFVCACLCKFRVAGYAVVSKRGSGFAVTVAHMGADGTWWPTRNDDWAWDDIV